LFFALWPAPALQQSLAGTTQSVLLAAGGRPVPPENFHVTLAFLGSVPDARISEVAAIGVDVASQFTQRRMTVTLDAIEYWQKPKVVVATARLPAAESAPLANVLAVALKSRLPDAGFAADLETSWSVGSEVIEEFRPHVTLARKVSHPIPPTDMDSVVWRFTEFALVESRTEPGGSAYRVLASFPWEPHEGLDPGQPV
jgi:RNA 2',3'-cyclic 3'-phosphodiesterase